MKRLFLMLTIAALAGACRPAPPPAAAPAPASARGALEIVVEPNPIVAMPVEEGVWRFPFTLRIRETGGSRVTIDRVGVDVFAVGGLKVYSTALDSAQIDSRGYPRTVAPGGEIRYQMAPQQRIPDARLFASVVAELWAEGTDASGTRAATRTRVSVIPQP